MNNISYEQIRDVSFRAKLRQNPTQLLNEYGFKLSKDTQVQVLSNTKDTYYVVFPSATMEHDDLAKLQVAGNSVGSVGSVGSFGTISSITSTGATVGSIGTVGTVGSAAVNKGGTNI